MQAPASYWQSDMLFPSSSKPFSNTHNDSPFPSVLLFYTLGSWIFLRFLFQLQTLCAKLPANTMRPLWISVAASPRGEQHHPHLPILLPKHLFPTIFTLTIEIRNKTNWMSPRLHFTLSILHISSYLTLKTTTLSNYLH